MTRAGMFQLLREKAGYQTPETPARGWADRAFGRTDAWFYACLSRIVFQAGAYARKHAAYPPARWSDDGFAILALAERCGGKVSFEGYEHVADGGLKIFVANHMSMLETLILPPFLMAGDRPLAVVIKASLTRYPAFGHVMRHCGAIVVNRSNPREDLEKVLADGRRAVAEGRSVILFPQSTRERTFNPAHFNSLGVKLARAAGVPLVPIATCTDFMGVGRLVRDCGPIDRSRPIRFRVGRAMPVPDATAARHVHQAAVGFITEALREWSVPVAEGDAI